MIKTDHIVKAFDGKTVLDGLTLTFEENRCTVFMGASGTGKTTLMNILSGLTPPDSGTVTGLDGIKKSFVFQENRLLENRSALKNILCLTPDRERALFFLGKTGLEEFAGQKVSGFSGGMKRRLAIARALACGGDAYFLDEPLREMDENTLASTADVIREELRGKTAFMITHDRAQAEYFGDRIITFDGSPLRVSEDEHTGRR